MFMGVGFAVKYSFPVAESERLTTSRVKIVFETSSDFFGRITIYKLDNLLKHPKKKKIQKIQIFSQKKKKKKKKIAQ
jgi:hypothetical protein